MDCQTIIHNSVCVEAQITITPQVTVGEIQSYCLGNPIIGGCPNIPIPRCSFRISQNICIQVPLTFSANASAAPPGIVCAEPGIGECVLTPACTYTIGYFKDHPDVTNALITDLGDSIILGIDDSGLSYTVTTSNANDVLDFNTESPPAPSDPSFANQYQVLYAQLLAANLNVANGATCPFATSAIAAANAFIAMSPAGGMAGAPTYQMPLAQYNEGSAPGCPFRCPDDMF